MALCFSATTPAATIAVGTSNLTAGVGNCTLLEAVAAINQGSVIAGSGCIATGTFGIHDTIELKNFAFGLSSQSAGGNVTGDTAIVLTKPVTLKGNLDPLGGPLASISRSSSAPYFRLIKTSASLTLIGVRIQNGSAEGGGGGALYATGTGPIQLSHCQVLNSVASDSGGGIMVTQASLLIDYSSISGNTTGADGAGVYSGGTAIVIKHSTISGNTAAHGRGGGIFDDNANVVLSNSTIQDNYASLAGGGVFANAATLNFCTVADNSTHASVPGGGLLVEANTYATASLLYGNNPGDDIDSLNAGTILGGNHNLIGTHGNNISLQNASISCNPNLGSLAQNGGPTPTLALPVNSCAVDAGPTMAPQGIAYDQRGSHYPRRIGAATDIGAFEVQPTDRIFIDGFDL